MDKILPFCYFLLILLILEFFEFAAIIIGILEFFRVEIKNVNPPESSLPDIPSTSSKNNNIFFPKILLLSNKGFIIDSKFALFLKSLAFNSTIS